MPIEGAIPVPVIPGPCTVIRIRLRLVRGQSCVLAENFLCENVRMAPADIAGDAPLRCSSASIGSGKARALADHPGYALNRRGGKRRKLPNWSLDWAAVSPGHFPKNGPELTTESINGPVGAMSGDLRPCSMDGAGPTLESPWGSG